MLLQGNGATAVWTTSYPSKTFDWVQKEQIGWEVSLPTFFIPGISYVCVLSSSELLVPTKTVLRRKLIFYKSYKYPARLRETIPFSDI